MGSIQICCHNTWPPTSRKMHWTGLSSTQCEINSNWISAPLSFAIANAAQKLCLCSWPTTPGIISVQNSYCSRDRVTLTRGFGTGFMAGFHGELRIMGLFSLPAKAKHEREISNPMNKNKILEKAALFILASCFLCIAVNLDYRSYFTQALVSWGDLQVKNICPKSAPSSTWWPPFSRPTRPLSVAGLKSEGPHSRIAIHPMRRLIGSRLFPSHGSFSTELKVAISAIKHNQSQYCDKPYIATVG